jgi:uncharacterized membrane protein YesL
VVTGYPCLEIKYLIRMESKSSFVVRNLLQYIYFLCFIYLVYLMDFSIYFLGVDRPSMEWSITGQNLSLRDYTLMRGWGANVVRLALKYVYISILFLADFPARSPCGTCSNSAVNLMDSFVLLFFFRPFYLPPYFPPDLSCISCTNLLI